jgi:hypothetical protein
MTKEGTSDEQRSEERKKQEERLHSFFLYSSIFCLLIPQPVKTETLKQRNDSDSDTLDVKK